MHRKKLIEIAGREHVIFSLEELAGYASDLSFAGPVTPAAIVRPANVPELQSLVRWANETHTPLVPISSGPPHFRGDTVPGAPGAVIVDLRNMDRIIRIDPSNRVAIVEPGVTFGLLQTELEKVGLRPYLPLVPRSTKSVIGSVLEREPVTVPSQHWDSTDPMLCAEIVFGTGDKTRTGEAAGPDPLEKQWEIGKAQLSPFGPTQMDIQRLVSGAQGTIGFTTWISLKCRSLARMHKSLLVPSPSLTPLTDLYYQLLRTRLGETLFIINGFNLACLLGSGKDEIERLSAVLPPWVLLISLEGYDPLPGEKVQYQQADLVEMAHSFGLKPEDGVPGANAEAVYQVISRPSSDPYWKMRHKGGFQELFCLTTLEKTPLFIEQIYNLANSIGYPRQNIGVYIQAIVQGTSCHCEFVFSYDPQDLVEAQNVKKLMSAGAGSLPDLGGFFSRPYGEWADVAYSRAGNSASIQKLVKHIFDPEGIMNPGKLCFKPT